MPTFEPQFLAELKAALTVAGFSELSEHVDQLRVHEFVEGRRPTSQFIYVVPKPSLPSGELARILVGGVPGLLCLLVDRDRIAIVETLSRDVLVQNDRSATRHLQDASQIAGAHAWEIKCQVQAAARRRRVMNGVSLTNRAHRRNQMGAWSHEPFGNDDAGDWADGLEEAEDLSYIEAALDAVLEAKGYLEAPEASCAIAAVEVVAKLLGKGTQSDAYSEKVDEWVGRIRAKPSRSLLEKAHRALEKVRGDESELKELWHEGDAMEWEASLDSLRAAVSA